MCGICGIVRRTGPATERQRERVESMVHALAHRGPDASTVQTIGEAVLGITRLTIRAPEGGWQPIVDAASGSAAICNGEIDNHQQIRSWLSEQHHAVDDPGDVSVLSPLYAELGPSFAERLIGAFAIAVWDPQSRDLLLVRDRAGERPLFYVETHDEIVFATEIAALAADPEMNLEIDQDGVLKYLQRGVFPAPFSPFREIRKVRPGEVVRFGPADKSSERYWRWSIATEKKSSPDMESFDRTFRQSVYRQSEVDVNFGVFLSGGVDSSLVASVARSLRPDYNLRAYTIRFSESSYDEGAFAHRVATQLGMECVEVWIRPQDMAEELPRLIQAVGEPLADPAWIPTALLARRASEDIRIALVGEGGDELFGGYPTYMGAIHAERFRRLPKVIRSLIRSIVYRLPDSEKKMPVSFLLRRFVDEAEQEGIARHLQWTAGIPLPLLKRLGVRSSDFQPPDDPGELLDRLQLLDFETSLGEGLLTKADRASMRSALELRAPFLDADVIQFAASLPRNHRVRGLTTKAFLKRYALRYLPRSIVHRRKRGLSLPLAGWLRGPLYDWARHRIETSQLDRVGIQRDAALQLLEDHHGRVADYGRPMWSLLVLAEWLDWAEPGPADAAD